MPDVADWWEDNIGEPGRLPLLACTVAFVVTFAVTRLIVRSIRTGRGPFHDVTVGSVHLHHAVPGIVLMALGGIAALTVDSSGWETASGAVFGIGLALVLDEFALVLHLQDVYWQTEGRTSVDAVFLVAGLLVLLLVGITPAGVDDLSLHHRNLRWLWTAELVLNAVLVAVTIAKGKVATGILGVLLAPLAWIGAVRLARPGSPWARWSYPEGGDKETRATARAAAFDRRWGGRLDRIRDLVAGAPTAPP